MESSMLMHIIDCTNADYYQDLLISIESVSAENGYHRLITLNGDRGPVNVRSIADRPYLLATVAGICSNVSMVVGWKDNGQ